MADFSIPITVPDNKTTELIAALRWHWGPKEDGSDMSSAELRAKLKESMEQSLKDIFIRHKKYLRDQQEINDSIEIT